MKLIWYSKHVLLRKCLYSNTQEWLWLWLLCLENNDDVGILYIRQRGTAARSCEATNDTEVKIMYLYLDGTCRGHWVTRRRVLQSQTQAMPSHHARGTHLIKRPRYGITSARCHSLSSVTRGRCRSPSVFCWQWWWRWRMAMTLLYTWRLWFSLILSL